MHWDKSDFALAMRMRPYNSATDYHILRDSVRAVGKAGGFLTAAKKALEEAGIKWPSSFNSNQSPEAIAIDGDCGMALNDI